jgi:diguanylate cyclase (GGDEF)-like protein
VYNAVGFAAALSCVAAARGEERRPWLLIGAAIASWTAGNVYYTVVSSNLQVVPSPSWADAGYLGVYPFAYTALALLVRRRVNVFGRSIWLDGVIAGLTVGAVSLAFVFERVAASASGGTASVATNLAYPAGDALLLAIVIAVFAARSWRLEASWLLIGVGFGVFAVSDSIYLLRVADGSYVYGSWLDLGWLLGFVLLSNAAWQPARAQSGASTEGRRVLVLPMLFALAALGLVVAASVVPMNAAAVALAAAALILVVVRMTVAVGEHHKLVAMFKDRSLTDPLTLLPNRRAMLDHLEAVFAEATQPHLLLLFDLNGFKAYNDTFGHLAGDALLRRLGHRLARAIDGRGRAFRLGGDEFCVIARGGHADLEWLTASTTAALRESGEAFSISCAIGHAELPREADTPDQALGLADDRMYANKLPRRAQPDPRAVLMQVVRERDGTLGEHIGTVALLSALTATRIGLAPAEIALVRDAAELHDVGKLAIPDAILNKPTALDDHEWELIRRHTLIGQRILAASTGLDKVAEAIRSTHERWDGAGYPDGLAGEAIPIAARIIAIADAYEVITTGRPYRTALSREDAIAELVRCAGTQFDPELVHQFVAVVSHPTLTLVEDEAAASAG